jgi:hypothetical protein
MSLLRRVSLPLVAAAFATATTASVSHAQFTTAANSTHHWLAIGFGGGEVIPTGNATQTYNSSFQGEAIVIINLGILPELRFSFGYQRFDLKQQVLNSLGYSNANGGYNAILNGVAGTRIDLMRGPVRPYITLGVGAFNIKTVIDSAKTSGSSYSSSSPTTTKFGIDGGAGLALHFGRVEAFGEGRVQNVFTNNGLITSAKQIQAVPVTFGFTFAVI